MQQVLVGTTFNSLLCVPDHKLSEYDFIEKVPQPKRPPKRSIERTPDQQTQKRDTSQA